MAEAVLGREVWSGGSDVSDRSDGLFDTIRGGQCGLGGLGGQCGLNGRRGAYSGRVGFLFKIGGRTGMEPALYGSHLGISTISWRAVGHHVAFSTFIGAGYAK